MHLIFKEDATPAHIRAVVEFLGLAALTLTAVSGGNGSCRSGLRFQVCGAGNPDQEPVLSRQLTQFDGVDRVEPRPFGPGAW